MVNFSRDIMSIYRRRRRWGNEVTTNWRYRWRWRRLVGTLDVTFDLNMKSEKLLLFFIFENTFDNITIVLVKVNSFWFFRVLGAFSQLSNNAFNSRNNTSSTNAIINHWIKKKYPGLLYQLFKLKRNVDLTVDFDREVSAYIQYSNDHETCRGKYLVQNMIFQRLKKLLDNNLPL